MPTVSAVAPKTVDLYEVTDDGEIKLNFHPGQWRAYDADERFVVTLAGTQGGKTSFGPWWLLREIELAGQGDYLIAAPTFKILEPKILPTFLNVFQRLLNLGSFVRSPVMRFTFSEEGARFLLGDRYDPMLPPLCVYFGHASNPDSLESATYRGAWLDECGQDAFKLGSWEAILRRLSLASGEGFGRVLLTTTVYNLGWIKAALYDKKVRDSDPTIKIVHFDSTENPKFPKEEFERARRDLPKWRFDMFYRGMFTRPLGLIYDSYDETIHETDRFVIADDWKRYMGIDFGPVNTAAVFLAERPTDRKLFLYRTYHAGERTAKQHVVHMLEGEPKHRLPLCYGGARSEDEWRNDFRGAGLPIALPPVNDVEVGILRVYGVHRRNEMLVFKDLDEYRAEKLTYSRELDANDAVTEKIKDKHSFHIMDAERYILGSIRPGVDAPNDKPGSLIRETNAAGKRQASILGRPMGIDENGRLIRGHPTPAQVSRAERGG
jgi:hypothetical protein